MTIKIIPKRKVDSLYVNPGVLRQAAENITTITHTGVDRELWANDTDPVLTLDQDGTGPVLLLEANAPEMRWAEVDQTDPVGRFGIVLTGGAFYLVKYLTAAYASYGSLLSMVNDVLLQNPDTDNDQSVRVYGGSGAAGKGAEVHLFGKSASGAAGELRLLTPNAAGTGSVQRLSISGVAATALATWASTVQHTGLQLKDLLLVGISELTIATGAITRTGFYHTVDTESDAATDDLDTISTASGQFLLIRAAHTDRTIVVKHATGNIHLRVGVDISLDNTEKALLLFGAGSNWVDL